MLFRSDFGTVQGFTLGYILRAEKNVTLRANYTLQFAKGTGSSAGSNLAIIASGQPNLRTLTNLSFDQRHRISATFDFRYDGGSNYNGYIQKVKGKDGKIKEIKWFQNAGATVLFSAGSGMPYSRSNTPFSNFGLGGRSQLSGSINGSNRPWIFQCDVRIDKTFFVNIGRKVENGKVEKEGKRTTITGYLDIANIFNFKNIVNVYTYTGNPEDDGVLASEQFQQLINSQIYVPSFVNYYNMAMRNPYNYSSPTTITLGIQFGF